MVEEKRFLGDVSAFDGELLHRVYEYCRAREALPLVLEFGHLTIEANGKIRSFRLCVATILTGKEWEDGSKEGRRITGSGGKSEGSH